MRQLFQVRTSYTVIEMHLDNGEVDKTSPFLAWMKGRKFAFVREWCAENKYDLIHIKNY